MLSSDDAARTGALLVSRGDLGTLSVSGPDRVEWLQGILTCDVRDLCDGDGAWGLLLSRQGKIFADVLVVQRAGSVDLGIVSTALPRALDWLASFLIMEDAELDDTSEDFAWLGLHGPRAAEIARQAAHVSNGFASSIDVTGLGGAVVVVPRAALPEARAAALSEGASLASQDDWLRLRVERAVPLFGVDIDDTRNPHEASLERRCISWTKGCYLGQEAVFMQDKRGKVKRRLSLLKLAGSALPPPGTPVTDESGALVGETRSAASSSILGGLGALSLLAASAATPGTRVLVAGSPGEVMEPNR